MVLQSLLWNYRSAVWGNTQSKSEAQLKVG
jgi:hypothetical protein